MRLIELLLLLATGAAQSASASSLPKRQWGWPGGGGGGSAGGDAGTVTVDPSKTYQTMDGFGFSLAFQRANLITNMADKVKQRRLLDLLFNTTSGAGMSILRNGIGSSPDSSSDHMNSFAPANPGGPNAVPKYNFDGKDSGQLFVAKEAQATYGVKTLYADAWSAPGYMKTNGNENNGGTLCGMPGANCQSGDWRKAYADYLAAYVKFYRDAGVTVTHLGFLNEPEFSSSYASMNANGAQAGDFIKILQAELEAEGLANSTGIACCDSEGWGNQMNMLNGIRSAGAAPLLRAVTSHTYTGGPSGAADTGGVPVWLSEQCDLNGQWTTAWYGGGGAGEGLTWANNIFSAVTGSNVAGFLYWEGVQWPSPNTNEKMIMVNADSGEIQVSARLWAFANWSRFVRPGAVRLGSAGGSGGGLKSAAFRNVDGSVAIVLISSASGESSVKISVGAGGEAVQNARAWASDGSRQCQEMDVVVNSDGTVSGKVPSRAIYTFVINTPAA